MSRVYLAAAIVLEICGTTSLKLSDGFTRFQPSSAVVLCYVLSFALLGLALRGIELSIAYANLMTRVGQRAPDANLEGVLISPMLTDGVEMILGVQHDGVFGPTVLLGLGGIFVEVLRDVTFRVAPFGLEEARAMIGELRGKAILEGARGKPAGDLDALAETLSKLSLFAAAQKGQFSSIDINPLLVRPKGHGVVALDALIVTDATPAGHH